MQSSQDVPITNRSSHLLIVICLQGLMTIDPLTFAATRSTVPLIIMIIR